MTFHTSLSYNSGIHNTSSHWYRLETGAKKIEGGDESYV